MKILVAEDEKDMQAVLKAMLEHNGYEVDPADNGRQAVELASKNVYDAMILDIMMPVLDGIGALKEIRSRGIVSPVLFLTAKSEVGDRIDGLDAGADDYLTKPFAMGELLARVRSMTRRSQDYNQSRISLGDLMLDTSIAQLSSHNTIRLAERELALMELFMRNPGREMDTRYIYERVWGEDPEGEGVVWVYISFLRGKLRSIGAAARIIGEEGGSFKLTAS